MANEKTYSYKSSIKEVSSQTNSFEVKKEENARKINAENQRAIRLALRKDFDGALEVFDALKNEEMIYVIKKCIELEPLFEQFLNGEITYAHYKKSSKSFPEEAKEIVQYKYPDLAFIEVRNLEKKFREKIEGIIDDLLSKNTFESLLEARKVYEKNIGIIKKPYNFDKLFIKTISFLPYSEFAPLYNIEWTEVDKLINDFLLKEANSFTKAEAIIKEIKVIEKNRDTIQIIIRKYNRAFESKLRQNYKDNKLKQYVREYKKHSFYFLNRNNKIEPKIEPFFLQRRIYAIYYVNEICELFLNTLKENITCLRYVPYENQKAYYHAIIRSVKITRDYSIFDLFPEEIIHGRNFIDVLSDTLEEDEVTIRGIVKLLKGSEHQAYMEELFLNAYKKELTFVETTKDIPDFNKENADLLIEKFKTNDHLIHVTKIRKILFKTLAAVELIVSAFIALAIIGVCFFAFRKQLYFLAVVLLIGGLILGIKSFVYLEEIITAKRERRLLLANRLIDDLVVENDIILKKVYLGID